MIGLSFDTELNRDIGVGYVGRKERNPLFVVGYAQGVSRHIICF